MTSRSTAADIRELTPERLQRLTLAATFGAIVLQAALHRALVGTSLLELSLLGILAWTVILTLLHEAVHAVGYALAGAEWSDLDFGVEWRSAHAWAACRSALPVEGYRRALILPLFVTGLLPWSLGLALGRSELALAGAILTGGASGDVVLWRWTRKLSPGTEIRDLSDRIGFEVAEPGPGGASTPSTPQRSRRS